MLCPLVIQHFAMENDRFQWLCQVTTGYLPHGVGPRTHCLRYPKLGYRTKAPNTKPAQFEFSENHCIFILQVSQLAVPHIYIYIHMYTHIYNIYIYNSCTNRLWLMLPPPKNSRMARRGCGSEMAALHKSPIVQLLWKETWASARQCS